MELTAHQAYRKAIRYCLAITLSLLLPLANSCKKENTRPAQEEKEFTDGVSVDNREVSTYQLVTLSASGDLKIKYAGTFGNTPVEVFKTSDTTLAVFVPEEAQGEHFLKFELATIKFQVQPVQTDEDPDEFIANFAKGFDADTEALGGTTEAELADREELLAFKQGIMETWGKMSASDRRQTHLFYTANKGQVSELIRQLNDAMAIGAAAMQQLRAQPVMALGDAGTVASANTDSPFGCPTGRLKDFHDCLGKHLGESMSLLRGQLREFTRYVAMAGAVGGTALSLSALGPFALGITAVGMALPIGMATYILLAEIAPTTLRLVRTLIMYLGTPWVFVVERRNANATKEYPYDRYAEVDVDAFLRTVEETDSDVTPNTGGFINALKELKPTWDKFKGLFKELPGFTPKKEAVELDGAEISVSDISNPNVAYVGQSGNKIKFRSLSQAEETFTYRIHASKEGFTESVELSGVIVLPAFELTGRWRLNYYTDDTRTNLGQSNLIDFGNGADDLGWPVSHTYEDGNVEYYDRSNAQFTFNQSFYAAGMTLVLTHNYWNIRYHFKYDPEHPNRLIGESIGLSNNGFNMDLVKQ